MNICFVGNRVVRIASVAMAFLSAIFCMSAAKAGDSYVRVTSEADLVLGYDQEYILVYDGGSSVSDGIVMEKFKAVSTGGYFTAYENSVRFGDDHVTVTLDSLAMPTTFSIHRESTNSDGNITYTLRIGDNDFDAQYIGASSNADNTLKIYDSLRDQTYVTIDFTDGNSGKVDISFSSTSDDSKPNLLQFDSDNTRFSNIGRGNRYAPVLYRSTNPRDPAVPLVWEKLSPDKLKTRKFAVLVSRPDQYGAAKIISAYNKSANDLSLTGCILTKDGYLLDSEGHLFNPMVFEFLPQSNGVFVKGYTQSNGVAQDLGYMSGKNHPVDFTSEPSLLAISADDADNLVLADGNYSLCWYDNYNAPGQSASFQYDAPNKFMLMTPKVELMTMELIDGTSSEIAYSNDTLKFNAPAGYHIHYMISEPVYEAGAAMHRGIRSLDPDKQWHDTGVRQYSYIVPSVDNPYQLTVKGVHAQNPAVETESMTMRVDPDGLVTGIDAVVEEGEPEAEVPEEYYTLQGIRVVRPMPGQLYICRQGTKVRKVRF